MREEPILTANMHNFLQAIRISKLIGCRGNWKKQYGLSTDDEYNLLVCPGHSSFFAIKKRRIVPCEVDDTQTAHSLVDCTLDGRHPT
jgi:hypothetical protein